ncbi:hypothetical protein [Streptomyces sp. Ncost-T10-10d]|uniref:hypothetical protein n=1 Tax=Streptomyces sp. Ncost-T10-10d TaxID=1839774 RepID=UPI0035224D37
MTLPPLRRAKQVAAVAADDGPLAVTRDGDGTVRLWDFTARERVSNPVVGHTRSVYTAATAVVEGRSRVVSGSGDGTVQVWDLATGRHIGEPLTNTVGGVTGPAAAGRRALRGRGVSKGMAATACEASRPRPTAADGNSARRGHGGHGRRPGARRRVMDPGDDPMRRRRPVHEVRRTRRVRQRQYVRLHAGGRRR